MKLSVVDQSPIPSGLTAADALQNSIQLARLCDRLGYHRYWLAEHHSTGGFACTAPEIMIARVAAETSLMRIGSGAVLLPHYAPLKVAETFRTLHALYPNRIDLGVGRAPGGTPLDVYALQRDPKGLHADDFPQRLLELLAFLNDDFPEDHSFRQIQVQPSMPGGPEVWLLGSSGWSADAAAKLGLPYAAAHFINPMPTRASVEHYLRHFEPSEFLDKPQVLIAASAIAAETQAEAERHYTAYRMRRIMRQRGERGAIPSPEEAFAELGDTPDPPPEEISEWPRWIYGTIDAVHEQLTGMCEALHVDELMVITVVHSHAARMRSYELLANAFGIEPRQPAPAEVSSTR
jgi:luciferase family oxidoreductase group 1